MAEIQVRAFAKVNITLDVLGKRDDGFHNMKTIMQTVGLYDEITIRPDQPWQITCNIGFLPTDEKNIAVRAAKLFLAHTGIKSAGLKMDIFKRIPICAGLAGGSADAAAVLLALNEYYGCPIGKDALLAMGRELGSDVPFCMISGTALAQGRGDELTMLSPMPSCFMVICKPAFPISTPALFVKLDLSHIVLRPDTMGTIAAIKEKDIAQIGHRMFNVFEDIAADEHDEIRRIKGILLDNGASGAVMTGTGPSVFGIFDHKNKAENAFESLKGSYQDTFFVEI